VFSYTAYSAFFSQPTTAKGLVGHWSLGDEDEILGADSEDNGGFELDHGGWNNTGSPSTSERTTSDKKSGSYSWHLVGASHGDGFWSGTDWNITTAKRYRLNFWYKVVSGTMRVIVKHGNQTYSLYIDDFLPTGSWTEFSVILQDTEGGASGSIWFVCQGAGAEFYVDDVSFKEVKTADKTASSNHGTVYGATYTTDRNGQTNKAMSFDGVDDYIVTTKNMYSLGDKTFAAWVKPSGTSTVGLFKQYNWRLTYLSGEDKFIQAHYNGSVYLYSNAHMNPDEWSHIVLKYNSSSETIDWYLNGQFDKTSTNAPDFEDTLKVIGSDGLYYFNGALSDLRIYDRALSEQEIQNLYQGYKPFIKAGESQKGLVGWWSLAQEHEYGVELVSNGTFDDTSGWVKGGGATPITVSDGQAVLYSGGAIYQQLTTTSGRKYKFSIDANEYGNAGILFGGVSSNWAHDPINYYQSLTTSATTTYESYFTATGTRSWAQIKELQGMSGYLYFDNVSIKEIYAGDKTTNSNNGTVYGATYTTDRYGVANKAMSFDGTDDYIDLSSYIFNVSDDGTVDEFTISAWVKWDAFPNSNNDEIISWWQTGVNTYPDGFLGATTSSGSATNANPYIRFGDDWANSLQLTAATDVGVWIHLVAVKTSDNAYVYKNGILGATKGSPLSWGFNALPNIGRHPAQSEYFNGSISDIRIYDRALSATEIAEIYGTYNPVVKVGNLQKGLVGRWSFSDKDEVLGAEMLVDANAASDLYGNEANATTGWSGTATVVSSSSDPSAGTYHLDITGGAGYYLTHAVSFTSGRRYKLLYDAKVLAHSGLFHVSDTVGYGWNDNRIELGYFGATSYTTYEPYFTANSTAVALNLWLTGASTRYYIDNFSLKSVYAADLTINNSRGAVYGASYTQDRNGQTNNAMFFDGTDDFIDLETSPVLNRVKNNFTLAFWAYPLSQHEIDSESTSGVGGVSGQKYATGPWFHFSPETGVGASVGTNGVSLYEHSVSHMPATLVWQGSLSGWTHVAVVYNERQPALYINGVYVKTGLTSAMTSVSIVPGCIGGMSYGFFHGSLSDLRIYNRALSAEEVKTLYEQY